MTENIKKLLELATDKRELQDKLNKANKEELIAIASENGISLTDADFAQSSEINDDELGSVAGGSGEDSSCPWGGVDIRNTGCSCSEHGVGVTDTLVCVCVLGGSGRQRMT